MSETKIKLLWSPLAIPALVIPALTEPVFFWLSALTSAERVVLTLRCSTVYILFQFGSANISIVNKQSNAAVSMQINIWDTGYIQIQMELRSSSSYELLPRFLLYYYCFLRSSSIFSFIFLMQLCVEKSKSLACC